jgi:hypothetical protein
MIDRRLDASGSMTHEMETPYGTAMLYVTGEASRTDVSVRDADRRLVVKGRYERSRYAGTEWKPETNTAGHRKPFSWGNLVPKKDRHNMQVVVDALVLSWLKSHETDMQALRVASRRSRAWRTAQTANEYADIANKLARESEELAA